MSSTTSECEEMRCCYCGRPLEELKLTVMGKSVRIGYKSCLCDEACEEGRKLEQMEYEAYKAQREKEMDAGLLRCGIGKRFLHSEHEKASQVRKAILENKNVYIYGEVGALKTTLACASARLLYPEFYYRMHFATSVELMDEIKASFDSLNSETERSAARRLSEYKLLMIDDLGKENATEFTLTRLFDIVNRRNASMVPTLITTQYKPSELIARLARHGDEETAIAIVSRLRQDCLAIHLDGGDRRRMQ